VPLRAVAAPLPVLNIDTDQIMPMRFIWRKRNDGWAHLLPTTCASTTTASPKRNSCSTGRNFALSAFSQPSGLCELEG
jgi:3-isopropylmalate dehydratase small subunit